MFQFYDRGVTILSGCSDSVVYFCDDTLWFRSAFLCWVLKWLDRDFVRWCSGLPSSAFMTSLAYSSNVLFWPSCAVVFRFRGGATWLLYGTDFMLDLLGCSRGWFVRCGMPYWLTVKFDFDLFLEMVRSCFYCCKVFRTRTYWDSSASSFNLLGAILIPWTF